MDLKDKVAIVTGGNGGLGQRICHALASSDCHVAVVYAQSKNQAREVAGQLQAHGVEAEAFQCDVSEPDQVSKLAAAVEERFGQIDILINDAAFNKSVPFQNLDELTCEFWNKIMSINLTGPMLCIKAVAPAMKKQGVWTDHQYFVDGRARADGIVDCVFGVQGGAHSSHKMYGGGAGA